MPDAKILLVEDDPAVRHGMAAFLRASGLDVDETETFRKALERFRDVGHDIVVADYSLPDGTSLDLLPEVKKISEETPFIILTAHGSIDLAVRAIKEGAEQFLTKPVESKALLLIIRRLLEQQRLRKRQELALREQPGTLDPFLGTSAAIRQLEERARLMLEWDSPVLILGETGSGKGVLARWVHANGPRREEAFVNLNCAGLSRELLESELFGHERGAFTGADRLTRGRFEQANGGTLFLDEISHMPLAFQQKILRVVEYGSFTRVGGTHDITVNVRMLAATNADLSGAMKAGSFLADLYDRLAFEVVRVPPLRERQGDVAVLARYFLREFLREVPALGEKGFAADAMALLERYPFPGNVRELKTIVERAAYRDTTQEINIEDLALPASDSTVEATFDERVEAFERRLLQESLSAAKGNRAEAARRLGLAYHQFRYYAQKLNIAGSDKVNG